MWNNAPHLGPLRYAADTRTLAFLILFNGLLAFQWLNLVRGASLLLATYLLAVIALVIKHNHVHSPTFRKMVWNRGFELWLSVLTGHPTSGIITSHNILHHGSNNTDADFVRCSLVKYRSNLLNLLVFFFVSVRTMYREKPTDLVQWRHSRPDLYRQAMVERALTYSFSAVLFFIDWRATLKYCVGPWFFAQWFLVTINLLQHQDCDFSSDFNHSRNITGRILNWLLLNNGYHTAHHLYPAAHWSRLRLIHERVVVPRTDPVLQERSLCLCLWRRFVAGNRWQGAPA